MCRTTAASSMRARCAAVSIRAQEELSSRRCRLGVDIARIVAWATTRHGGSRHPRQRLATPHAPHKACPDWRAGCKFPKIAAGRSDAARRSPTRRRRQAAAAMPGRGSLEETMDDAPGTFPGRVFAHAKAMPGHPATREKDLGIWQTWTWSAV